MPLRYKEGKSLFVSKQICVNGHYTFVTGRKKSGSCRLCAIKHQNTYNRRVVYGISDLDYDRLYQIQQGKCKICKKHQSELKTSLCTDHNHKTGRVRGLLCNRCNLNVGIYEKFSEEAKAYLLHYQDINNV